MSVAEEVAEAAQQSRKDGRHPPGLDRELDQSYRRLVRHRPEDDRLTQAIWSADAAAHITADAGLGETVGTVKRFVKRVLAKLVRWYVLRITTQVTAFANAATSALRLLSDRVEALVEEVEASRPPALPGRVPLTSGSAGDPPAGALEGHAPFADLALERLSGAPGRVLHADCRSGALVQRLCEAGADAYGVEAFAPFLETPAAPGLDLVHGDVLAHLRSVPAHGLGGVLLSGCVDRLAAGDARRLAFLLGTRVVAGGTVVLVGVHPAAWRIEASPVERDLSPGRPLHPETWGHLLGEHGFGGTTVVDGPPQAALASLPAELEVVRRLLDGPASFAVVATRSRGSASPELPVRPCVDQVIPTIVERDAVSTHALEVQRVLHGLGVDSEIFAQNIGAGLHGRVRPVADLDRDRPAGRSLLYQASIGSEVAEIFARHPAPKLLNYHNITPVELIGWWQPHLAGELTLGREQLRQLAPLTRLGIAVSRYNESELRDCGYAATAVAPLLVDLGAHTEPDAAVLARLAGARDAGGAAWLFVGQVAPHKCQHELVQALAFHRVAYDPQARLHLVGRETSARYAQVVRRLIGELGLEDAVVMEGSVTDRQLAAFYEGADVLVCCSEHEGFCAPLIEAMHHRLPIVAYGAAAVPETVADAGVVLPAKAPSLVAAAVDRVLGDASLREQLTAAGQRRAHDFDIERARTAFASAVEPLLGAGA